MTTLNSLPDPGDINFDKKTRAALDNWKTVIESMTTGGTGGTHVHAYQSTLQSLTAATWTKILYQTEDRDTQSEFATSTFTATDAGYYLFVTGVVWNGPADGERHILELFVNGSPSVRIADDTQGAAATYGATYGTKELYLDAGDTVDVYGYSTIARDTLPGSRYTWLVIANSTGVMGLTQGTGISIDNTDPAYPVVSLDDSQAGILDVVAGTGIDIDKTSPQNPTIALTSVSNVRAYSDTDQSISAATWTKVVFGTEDYDDDFEFATSTFTAKTAGTAVVSVSAKCTAGVASESTVLRVYKNGSTFAVLDRQFNAGTEGIQLSGTADVKVAVGDTIEAYFYSSAGNTIASGQTVTYMTVRGTR